MIKLQHIQKNLLIAIGDCADHDRVLITVVCPRVSAASKIF